MDLGSFFQIGPYPADAITGYYNLQLVGLSYLIASLASYVALDITERIRTNEDTLGPKLWWLIGGALAMGTGIWTMHFIGMLAFIMPMQMTYDPLLTGLSLLIAVIVSAFALFLIKNEKVKSLSLLCGGVLLGLGIVCMHYTGMSAMMEMKIRYVPSIFLLSVAIAIIASEAALWLMIQGTKTTSNRNLIKIGSAMVMGFAICGMHYTGQEAAIFTHYSSSEIIDGKALISPQSLSLFIGSMTVVIISLALFASKSWMNSLEKRNKKLLETEAILEQKTLELQKANSTLEESIKQSLNNVGRLRAILSAAGDGIIVADEEGKIEIANQAAEKIFGYSSNELAGECIFTFLQLKNVKAENALSNKDAAEDALFELTLVQKNKELTPVEINFSKSQINKKFVYIIVLRDITERKRVEDELNTLNRKLFTTARLAGMAEVASCMLHNVGNVLNSINVSTQLIMQRQEQLQTTDLTVLAQLLEENKKQNSLQEFLQNNRIGLILPQYLQEFAELWKNEQNFMRNELEILNNKVQHIRNIVAMQQSLCGNTNTIEKTTLPTLIEDALIINSEKITQYGIKIVRNFEDNSVIEIDKVKVVQVLVNLIKNASEAFDKMNTQNKTITITTRKADDFVHLEVQDNGIGIVMENLTKIFSYGFTTKDDGHGYGLHSSALTMQQMGGKLQASSNGLNEGAVFCLTFPINPKNNQINEKKSENEGALL